MDPMLQELLLPKAMYSEIVGNNVVDMLLFSFGIKPGKTLNTDNIDINKRTKKWYQLASNCISNERFNELMETNPEKIEQALEFCYMRNIFSEFE